MNALMFENFTYVQKSVSKRKACHRLSEQLELSAVFDQPVSRSAEAFVFGLQLVSVFLSRNV